MLKKLLNKIAPKRFYKSSELAAVLSDCFRFEDGGSGPRSQVFNNGGTLQADDQGHTRFYACAQVDSCISRVNKVIAQLENGEPVTSPDQIPMVKVRGSITRGKSMMHVVRWAYETKQAPEVAIHRLADNGIRADLETVTFIMDALAATDRADRFLFDIKNSQILPEPKNAEE